MCARQSNPSTLTNAPKEVILFTTPLTTTLGTTCVQKISSFAAAYGTILYYDDIDTVLHLQEKFPVYKDNFPIWAQQANGMLQFAIWTALAEAGVGASLQHYNPLIDEKVSAAFDVAASWRLVAQMPFGQPVAPAQEKTYLPLEQRLRIER